MPDKTNCFGIPDEYKGLSIFQGPDDKYYAKTSKGEDSWQDLQEIIDNIATNDLLLNAMQKIVDAKDHIIPLVTSQRMRNIAGFALLGKTCP